MTTTYITPHLVMGELSFTVQAERVADAQAALASIRSGTRALLPAEDWDTAEEALTLLGLDEPAIADCLHFARTARTHQDQP